MLHETRYDVLSFNRILSLYAILINGFNLALCACPCKYCGPTTLCHNMGLTEVPYTLPTKDVTRLLLYGNRIAKLEANEFAGMFQVTELDLHENRINEVDKDGFSGLENLESLHLSHNDIDFIPAGTLTPLKRLSRLFLDHNKLKRLPVDIPYLSQLQKLNLGDNEIKTIHWSSFHSLRRLKYAFLWRNSLQCDCNLSELIKWFHAGSNAESINSDVPKDECGADDFTEVCAEPKVLQVTHLHGNNTVNGPSPAIYVQSDSAILQCNVSGTPSPLIVWKTPSAGYVYPYTSDRMMAYNNGTLIIQNLRITDTGKYTCHPRLVNDANVTSLAIDLKVVKGLKPVITYYDESVEGTVGSRVVLNCETTGSPTPSIQWYPPRSLASLQGGVFSQNGTTKYHQKETTLEIFDFSQNDTGTWRCRASNSMGFDAAYIQVRFAAQDNQILLIFIIVACVVVGIIIVIVTTVTCVMARRRKRKERQESQTGGEQSTRVMEEETQENDRNGRDNERYLPDVEQQEVLQQPYTQVPEVKGIRI